VCVFFLIICVIKNFILDDVNFFTTVLRKISVGYKSSPRCHWKVKGRSQMFTAVNVLRDKRSDISR